MAADETLPNVLLVVFDSARARNCSLYGYDRRTTPFLETLAAESTVYTQARAPSNWSLPSHVSLFTGIEAHAHQVTVHDRLRSGATIFETLADRGYDTGLFTENGFLASHETGIKHAFETVETVPDDYETTYDTAALNPGPDGFYYADAFEEWRADREGLWAGCVNLMDCHRPFEPRSEYDRWSDDDCRTLQADLPTRWEWEFYGGDRSYDDLSKVEQLYDGGIRQADAILERIVTRLREADELDETLVVVCGDHGDGFGDPGLLPAEPRAVSHIIPMSESLLRVPLVVRPPGGNGGHQCHEPAALTAFPDVVSESLDGTDDPTGFARKMVYATKQPVTDDLRERFETNCADPEPFFSSSQAVYVADRSAENAVRKRYYWGDTAVECRIGAPGDLTVIGPLDPASVTASFGESMADVREPLSGQQVTDAAKEQLTALGYY